MNRKKTAIYIISFGAVFFLLTFFISANSIGDEVKSHCEIAQKEYKGDKNIINRFLFFYKTGFSVVWPADSHTVRYAAEQIKIG